MRKGIEMASKNCYRWQILGRTAVGLALLAVAAWAPQAAADGDLVWARSMGGTSEEAGNCVAIDTAGNVYTTGFFLNTTDLDPGPGTLNFTSAGDRDFFVQKLDPTGELLWAHAIGGTSTDTAFGIAVDAAGNCYITGHFVGTVDFDPGPGVSNLTSAGGFDVFVLKLDGNGNLVWARAMGGNYDETAYSIAVDIAGNVYTTGRFATTGFPGGSADFDPGPGTAILVGTGYWDTFIAKLDTNGNFVWARAVTGTIAVLGHGIAVDSASNVYTAGYFQGTVDFDPGSGTVNLSGATEFDLSGFVQKMDADGNFLWARATYGTSADAIYKLAVDVAGYVYTTGRFAGTVDFDPGPDTLNLVSIAGGLDAFVQKLDTNGNLVWARAMGGTDWDQGDAIAADGAGNVFTIGLFNGTADLDPGPGSQNLTSAGDIDVFVQKLDTNGNFIWARAVGGTGQDWPHGIAVDAVGEVYVTGHFAETADFDPGPGTANLTSAGAADVFVLKLSGPDLVPPNAITITPATTGPINTDSITFTITFDEEVQSFNDASDLLITHSGTAHTGASVTGGGDTYSVTITGLSGEGTFALAVSTASDVEDLAGNALASSVTSADVAIDRIDPSFSGLSVIPVTASAGETITLTFASSEELADDPEVTINGNAATRSAKAAFTYEYTILPSDPLGPTSIEISGFDPAGNLGVLSDTAALTISAPAQPMPVRAWPVAALLLLAHALLMLQRSASAGKRHGV